MRSYRTTAIAGWILALLALAACLVLGAILTKRLAIEHRLRADPIGLRTLKPIEELPEDPRLLLTGDSRAAQLGTPRLEGWSVMNRGISGQSTDQVAARFARDLLLLAPDHAIVIAGINDLKDGDGDDRVLQSLTAFRDIADLAEAAGVPLTIVEVWGAGDVIEPRRLLLPTDLPDRIMQVNEKLRDLSSSDGCWIVRADALLNDDSTVPATFAKDTLHLNADGNRTLASVIEKALPVIETKDD